MRTADAASLEGLPTGLADRAYRWTDLHGEGVPGILAEQGPAWLYKRNLSPLTGGAVSAGSGTSSGAVSLRLAPPEIVPSRPNVSLSGGAEIIDLAGDGLPDVVTLDGPVPGFYEHGEREDWTAFRPLNASPSRAIADRKARFVDLDGDGRADLLITEDDALVWHRSLGEDGFAPALRVASGHDEDEGPRVVCACETRSIYVADMSGDGSFRPIAQGTCPRRVDQRVAAG